MQDKWCMSWRWANNKKIVYANCGVGVSRRSNMSLFDLLAPRCCDNLFVFFFFDFFCFFRVSQISCVRISCANFPNNFFFLFSLSESLRRIYVQINRKQQIDSLHFRILILSMFRFDLLHFEYERYSRPDYKPLSSAFRLFCSLMFRCNFIWWWK